MSIIDRLDYSEEYMARRRKAKHKEKDMLIHPEIDKSQTKYEVKNGGFTPQDLYGAETCRSEHFQFDLELLIKYTGGFFENISFLPDHFFECNTMREKLIEFGFAIEVKETYKVSDRFRLKSQIGTEEEVMLFSSRNKHWAGLVSLETGVRIETVVGIRDKDLVSKSELDRMYNTDIYTLELIKS